MNNTKTVAVINPPIITIASGLCDSEPIPWLIAAGISPNVAIAIGLTLECTLFLTDSCKDTHSTVRNQTQ